MSPLLLNTMKGVAPGLSDRRAQFGISERSWPHREPRNILARIFWPIQVEAGVISDARRQARCQVLAARSTPRLRRPMDRVRPEADTGVDGGIRPSLRHSIVMAIGSEAREADTAAMAAITAKLVE